MLRHARRPAVSVSSSGVFLGTALAISSVKIVALVASSDTLTSEMANISTIVVIAGLLACSPTCSAFTPVLAAVRVSGERCARDVEGGGVRLP